MTSEQSGTDAAAEPTVVLTKTVDLDSGDTDGGAYEWKPPPLPAKRAFALADLRAAAVFAVVLVVLGAPVGWLWSVLSPHATAARIDGQAVYTGFNGEVFIAADGILAAFGLVIGLAAGIIGYSWLSRRGPWMAIALAVGGAGGSVLASYVGHQIGLSTFNQLVISAPANVPFMVPVALKSTGVLFIEPLVAVLVYVVTAGWSKFGDLRRGDFEIPPEVWGEDPPPGLTAEVSSGSEAHAAQPAGPGPPSAAGASSPHA